MTLRMAWMRLAAVLGQRGEVLLDGGGLVLHGVTSGYFLVEGFHLRPLVKPCGQFFRTRRADDVLRLHASLRASSTVPGQFPHGYLAGQRPAR